MAGGNVPWIRSAIPYPDYRFHHWRRRIASSRIMLGVIAIELYNLREVGLPCEYVLNSALVEVESICTKLEAVLSGEAIMDREQEPVSGIAITLADRECRDQLGIRINRHKHPRISHFVRIGQP